MVRSNREDITVPEVTGGVTGFSRELSALERGLCWLAGDAASLFGGLVRYETGLGVLGKSLTTMAELDNEGRMLGGRRYLLGALMVGEGLSRIVIGGLELSTLALGVLGYGLGGDARLLLDAATDVALLEGVKASVALSRRALVGAGFGGWRGAIRYATEPLREYLPRVLER